MAELRFGEAVGSVVRENEHATPAHVRIMRDGEHVAPGFLRVVDALVLESLQHYRWGRHRPVRRRSAVTAKATPQRNLDVADRLIDHVVVAEDDVAVQVVGARVAGEVLDARLPTPAI